MKHTAQQPLFRKTVDASIPYVYTTTIGNKLYVRQRTPSGAPVYVECKYAPTYYLPTHEPSLYVGVDGTYLEKFTFSSLYESRDFLKEHQGEVYGDIQPEYMILADTYGAKDVPYAMEKLYIWNIDIEVDKDAVRGHAPVDDPFNPVISIAVSWRHMDHAGIVAYGTKPYETVGPETYVLCDDEQDMLRRFLADWRAGGDVPDIVTGYNIEFYDIPYLVNRMRLLFGEETARKLSPFDTISERKVTLTGREHTAIDIRGVSILDYFELYRKFTYSQLESYRLDHVAYVELGKRKVSYKEYRSLDRLYRENHDLFIRYNIKDVQLVDELDAKLKFIELVCALGYNAKANFNDTSKQVRLWDVMIYHHLKGQGREIPPRRSVEKNEQYIGAYVKDPLVGLHDWVVSFDVASMYPHIIREWNLSPETIVDKVHIGTVEDLLSGRANINGIPNDLAVAANGTLTKRDVEGFLPNMLKTLYDERVRYKKLAGQAKKQLEKVKQQLIDAPQAPELLAQKKQLEANVSAFNNNQLVRKVNLNSAYGAIGSNYFRFYDLRLAEAVTMTGQYIIRHVAHALNAFLNVSLRTNDVDYVIASDTDSVYLRLATVVEEYRRFKPHASTRQIVAMLDAYCDKQLRPVIDAAFTHIAAYLRAYTPCLSMAREVIADRGVWTAKKRYILNVLNSEGVDYDPPKLKIMGIEAVKSSTPAICRTMIKEAMRIFMNGTQEELWSYIETCRREFRSASFEDVAFPRSVNGLSKYAQVDKGVPIHVAGALVYNRMLREQQLDRDYETVKEGEKIKFAYLTPANPFHSHVLSVPHRCPDVWNIEQWIDYQKQFDKSFLEPLAVILACGNWSVEPIASLF